MIAAAVEEEKEEATVEIAADGDVVFVVGPAKKRLRVHSLFARTASPVLKAMLDPNFQEGRQLATDGFVEVELPEDDPQAIETVFNVVHGRNAHVSHKLNAKELLRIAITTDKYDCLEPLAFAVQLWFSCAGITDSDSLWALALAGYLFRNQKYFSQTTMALTLHHGGSYLDLVRKYEHEEVDYIVMLRMAVMLEEARSKLQTKLLMETLSGDWQCNKGFLGTPPKSGPDRHRPEWQDEFVKRVQNLQNTSISGILESLEKPTPYTAPTGAPGASQTGSFLGSPNPFYDRDYNFRCKATAFRTQNEIGSGLCMECIQTGQKHRKHKQTNTQTCNDNGYYKLQTRKNTDGH